MVRAWRPVGVTTGRHFSTKGPYMNLQNQQPQQPVQTNEESALEALCNSLAALADTTAVYLERRGLRDGLFSRDEIGDMPDDLDING